MILTGDLIAVMLAFVMLAFLTLDGLVAIAVILTMYDRRVHRVLCEREKGLLGMMEQWEALRQGELREILAHYDGISWVMGAPPDEKEPRLFYVQIWRS